MSEHTHGAPTNCDVVIVGAGPAGTSAAISLAVDGARVVLLEAKKFPRHKLCGEFVSPECANHFRRLGVEANMRAATPVRIAETVFYSKRGRNVSVPSEWFGSSPGVMALGLSRSEMDSQLLARARAVGVEVREDAQATSVLLDAEGVARGVRYRNADATAAEVRARITLDATGRSRVLGRAAERAARGFVHSKDVAMPERTLRERASLVAFKAHLVGARGLAMNDSSSRVSRCEIYFYDGGYGGLNNVEGDVSNVCFIVKAEDVRRYGGDAERVLHEVVFRNRRARQTLAEACAVTPWLSVALESFGRHALAPAPGLLAIGDAASFIDPFTGSGMLMALESGETVAETICAWRRGEPALATTEDERRALTALTSAYTADYANRFCSRLRVCSYLRRAAFAPSLAIESATVLLGMSTSARRRFARATRGAKRAECGVVIEEN